VERQGRLIKASTLFEPKVGGAGHLLLIEDEDGKVWARILAEPDGAIVNLVAVIVDGEWETSDESIASEVRHWLRALHGIQPLSTDAGTGTIGLSDGASGNDRVG
jgi:hypothetical protein